MSVSQGSFLIGIGAFKDPGAVALPDRPLGFDPIGEIDLGKEGSPGATSIRSYLSEILYSKLVKELQANIPEGKHIRLGPQWGEKSSYNARKANAKKTQFRYLGLNQKGIAVYQAYSEAPSSALLSLNWKINRLPFIVGRPNFLHLRAYEADGGRVEDVKVSLEASCTACGLTPRGRFIDTDSALFYLGRAILEGVLRDEEVIRHLGETYDAKLSDRVSKRDEIEFFSDKTPCGVLRSRILLLECSAPLLERLNFASLVDTARVNLFSHWFNSWNTSLERTFATQGFEAGEIHKRITPLLLEEEIPTDFDDRKTCCVLKGEFEYAKVPTLLAGEQAFSNPVGSGGPTDFEIMAYQVFWGSVVKNFGESGIPIARNALNQLKY